MFLIIFSFQVLPVKQLGKMLFKNMMTEEIHECSSADDGPTKLKKSTEYFKLFEDQPLARISYLSNKVSTALHAAEALPNTHIPDIFAPPPNVA